MPLNQVTTLVSGQLRRHITGYHMSKLTTEALRILTELAFAIDDRHIPIDYQRRRGLAAAATLIDDATWARMTREAGMRLAPTASARRHRPAACSTDGESAANPCTGSRPTSGSPRPPGPAPTPRAPTQPPSTAPCWTTGPRPSRSRRTWASPSATCARCCAGTRCPGPAAQSAIPSSPHPSQPAGLPASSPA
jgi:hypothetical protein